MAFPVGEVFVAVSPEAAGFAKKLDAQISRQGTLIGSIVGGNIEAKLALTTAAFLGAIGQQFVALNHQLQQETGATGTALKALAADATEAFKDTPTSLRNAGEAVAEFNRRGVEAGPTLVKLSEQAIELSKITGTDLASNVEQLTAVFAKFNVPVADQSRELDVFFKAMQASGKPIGDLISGLVTGAASLGQFGFSLDESTALIAGLEKAGVKLQPALAGLRKAFGQIAQEGGDPKKALQDLIEEFRSGQNPTKAMADAIKLFGARSGVELATAIQRGKFQFQDLLKTITDGKGGILATAEATRSFGEQLTILKNQVSAALAPVGLALVKVVKLIETEVGPGIVSAFSGIGAALAAAAPALAPLVVVIRALGVTLGGVGEVADFVGGALRLLPPQFIAVAGAIGLLTLAVHSATTGVIAFGIAFAATNPVIAAFSASILALGIALKFFGTGPEHIVKVVGDFTAAARAATDSFATDTGVFKAGVKSFADGMEEFIAAQQKAGHAESLTAAMKATHTNLGDLTTALTGTKTQWRAYEQAVISAMRSHGANNASLLKEIIALEDNRSVTVQAARAQIQLLESSKLLTEAQVKNIQVQNTAADGSINYGAALDQANKIAAIAVARQQAIAARTDEQRIATVQGTKAYADLADELAHGVISSDEFSASLAEMTGATQQATDAVAQGLTTAMANFVSTAVGALPTVGDAIQTFTSDLATARQNLTSALSTQASDIASAQQSLASTFASSADSVRNAQQSLRDALKARDEAVANATNAYEAASARRDKSVVNARRSLAETIARNNADIAKSQANLAKVTEDNAKRVLAATHKLAEDKSPQHFIDNLNDQTVKIATFQANLLKLVHEGFTPLAAELAKKGPEAAGSLAKALASDQNKANVANNAAALAQATTKGFADFIAKTFSPVKADGTKLGQSLIDGMAGGISAGNLKIAEAITSVTNKAVEVVVGQWRIHSPSLVARDLGRQFGEGLALGISDAQGSVASAGSRLGDAATRRIARADLAITGQAGSDRADAQVGVFAGAHITFPEKADPLHIASEFAWRLKT